MTNTNFNLEQVDEIANGDISFKKELIGIFLEQIPEFIKNMLRFLNADNFEDLAREAHTAHSSALIFGMNETGKYIRKIELQCKNKQKHGLLELINLVERDFDNTYKELKKLASNL